MTEEQRRWLQENFDSQVILGALMSRYTTFKIGGPADALVEVRTEEQLNILVRWLRNEGISTMVLGGGSNLLVLDGGIRAVIIKLTDHFDTVQFDATERAADQNKGESISLSAGSGAQLSRLSRYCIDNGVAGLTFAIGIPGTVGGALRMNAGAWGACMADVVSEIRVLTVEGDILRIPKDALLFRYRGLSLPSGAIILKGHFDLHRRSAEVLRQEAALMQQKRKASQPLHAAPSAGSIFKNPPEGLSAGALIDKAGLKGLQAGGAQISPKHANFIVNRGGAKASDVVCLIDQARKAVMDRFGIELKLEVAIVGQEAN